MFQPVAIATDADLLTDIRYSEDFAATTSCRYLRLFEDIQA